MRTKSIQIIAILFIVVVAGTAFWAYSQRKSLQPATVRLGMPTNKVRLSWKTFSYNEHGHFGAKTQFESGETDSLGGSYSLRCSDGKVYAVEITYPKGVDKAQCLSTVVKLIGHDFAQSEEHDAKELSLKNCATPSEYFYFEHGKIGVQLDFGKGAADGVTRVYCWTA